MQATPCLFCGRAVILVHVHGHYQCPVCNTNALPCCDGDNCETNQLLTSKKEDAISFPRSGFPNTNHPNLEINKSSPLYHRPPSVMNLLPGHPAIFPKT